MSPTVFEDLDDLLAADHMELGFTDWMAVEEPMVSAFALSTLDTVGATVAPMMLLSLTNRFLPELLQVPGASSGINYGAASVRFGPAVEIGIEVRAHASLVESVEVPGGVQTTVRIEIMARAGQEPCCVVESLSRWLR